MLLKSVAKRLIWNVREQPNVASLLRHPALQSVLEKSPVARALYGSGWDRKHPFDLAHGTDTSGYISADELPSNEPARTHAFCYGGSQPSLLRLAFASLPELDSYTFLDLGCGKGRALLVATEFPFRKLYGVELSPDTAQTARRNLARLRARFPARARPEVIVGDASAHPLPVGNLVIYMYHPFSAELVAKVVRAVELGLAVDPTRSIYVVYCNPVASSLFDASPALRRRFARMVPYAPEEVGFGPDDGDALLIWQPCALPVSDEPTAGTVVLAPNGARATLDTPAPS